MAAAQIRRGPSGLQPRANHHLPQQGEQRSQILFSKGSCIPSRLSHESLSLPWLGSSCAAAFPIANICLSLIVILLHFPSDRTRQHHTLTRQGSCLHAHANHPSQLPTSVPTPTSCLLLAHGIVFIATALYNKDLATVRLLVHRSLPAVAVSARHRPFSALDTPGCVVTRRRLSRTPTPPLSTAS